MKDNKLSQLDQMLKDGTINQEDYAHKMKEILKIADEMLDKKILPCTACRYCTAHCPKGLDIPKLL